MDEDQDTTPAPTKRPKKRVLVKPSERAARKLEPKPPKPPRKRRYVPVEFDRRKISHPVAPGAVRREKGLNERQLKLVNSYFGAAHFNKARSLEMAGYKDPKNSYVIFRHKKVREEIERRHKEIKDRYKVDYESIVDEIARIAYSNPADYMEVDEGGGAVIRLDKANLHQLSAIGEITIDTYMEGRGESAREVKRVKVKPWNKLGALEALIKHSGLSKEKVEINVNGDLAKRLLAARKRVGTDDA